MPGTYTPPPDRLREMGQFLRQCRERLTPSDGTASPATARRRTPGLRRIDIAERIGCSEDLYARLEQGRYQPNSRLLQKVAVALDLSGAETSYLFNLAGIIPATDMAAVVEQLPPHVLRLLDHFEPNVSYAIGQRWDILGANQTARLVLPMLANTATNAAYSLEQNLVYQMFTDPHAPQIIGDWEAHAQRIVHDLRLDYSQAPADMHFDALITQLRDKSAQFCDWWKEKAVGKLGMIRKDIHHPLVGLLSFEQTVYRLLDQPGIKTIFYVPLDGATRQNIKQLRTRQEQSG